jgi:hypothetical protein
MLQCTNQAENECHSDMAQDDDRFIFRGTQAVMPQGVNQRCIESDMLVHIPQLCAVTLDFPLACYIFI